jgi:hypothetical protein
MKVHLLLLSAGTFGFSEVNSQIDYSRMYEHYKNFEQSKTVTFYLTGSHLYGKYNNVNMLLLAANLPQIDPNAQAIGCGGMIAQDRFLVGTDAVLFHNIFKTGDYVQTGAFEYYYAGCKFYDSEKAEAGVLTGFGLGYLNVYLRPQTSGNHTEQGTASGMYELYNIRPLRAGIFFYNFAITGSYHFSDWFSLGLIAGLDCIPGSAWNLQNYSPFSTITKLQEGNAKGYASLTAGFSFDR